jgi:hypothetical protein
MDWIGMERVTALVAVVALLVAIWSAWTAGQARAAASRLRARVVELGEALEQNRIAEATSAQLVPTLERRFGPSGQVRLRLRVENIGRGTATNVRMRMASQLIVAPESGTNEPLEIDEVAPGMAVSLPIDLDLSQVEENVKVELNWLDGAGRQQASKAMIRLT